MAEFNPCPVCGKWIQSALEQDPALVICALCDPVPCFPVWNVSICIFRHYSIRIISPDYKYRIMECAWLVYIAIKSCIRIHTTSAKRCLSAVSILTKIIINPYFKHMLTPLPGISPEE